MKELTFKKGNYGFQLRIEVLEYDGSPKDLSGITPYLKIWKPDGSAVVNRACQVSGENVVICSIEEGDFSEVGYYYAEVELQGVGYVEDTETFLIRVLDSA